jgi:signal recognition particle subunit SRP54
MVLQELGGRITAALRKMSDATLVDKAVIDSCMKEICGALLTADVNVKLVSELRKVAPVRLTLPLPPSCL